MKPIILALFTFASATLSLADCAGNGMYFWPRGGVVSQNPVFMIEGYANDQGIVRNLNSTYPVYLKSGDEIIKLVVKETCEGQFYMTQAILVPAEKLTAGKEYELIIENVPDYLNPLQTWNAEESTYEPVRWNVIAGEDTTPPTWTQKPDEAKKTLVHYGCGPAVYVHFSFAAYDESPLLLRTTVTNPEKGTSTVYYLDASDLTTVAVGHGMCSGAFVVDDANDYTVTFDLVDGSGNVKIWDYDPIKFTKPTDLNSSSH
ncbi:MAG: hypothetical protein HYZ14_10835 [Bacteroidetes bacterium]|nr:hypothetical protein [Bacteroidota bacterium]